MKIRYNDIRFYYKELQEWKDKQVRFSTKSTTFTKTIIAPDEKTIFNNGGENNNKVLLLLSAVRRDAQNYLKTHTIRDITRETDFFNLLDVVKHKDVIVKIDLKSAYWIKALKDGIITHETDEKYKKWYANIDAKYAKDDRLKALGSLATTTIFRQYDERGRFESERRFTEPTKQVYMHICDEIDMLMKDVNYACDGCIYYYWDCIFVVKQFESQVLEYLRFREYDVTVEETKLEYIKIGDIGYLLSVYDNKIYMTRKENIAALPQLELDENEYE